MKVRAQIAMVLNLDKCIGCHTCSVTCKNVWTSREGVEYAWFNNVETKPGIGYPKEWENQKRWNGGWLRKKNGKLQPRMGAKWRILANIFANPDLPEIDDYYEPFTFDYQHLHTAPDSKAMPTARPRSLVTGQRMEKIEGGPNWEEILGGEFSKRSKDINFEGVQKEIYGQFENTFMMYLPRLCEHCLNPACVSVCPSGAIYKREEDGIVLIDQDKCRGWRMCVSGCPYKKVYYNWQSGKSEKCMSAASATWASCSMMRIALPKPPPRRMKPIYTKRNSRSFLILSIPRFRRKRPPMASRTPGSKPPRSRRSGKWQWTGRWRFHCIPNTAPCRWSGMCRRCRRSNRQPRRDRSIWTATCPTFVRCAFR
jgi:Fe-S-cluster-containing dehydrogenase component